MLADYLKGDCWHSVTDGFRMYKLPADRLQPGTYPVSVQDHSEELVELFFCCGGSASIQRRQNSLIELHSQEILIISNTSDIFSVSFSEPLIGYCVSIKPRDVGSAFQTFCEALGHPDLSDGRIQTLLAQHGGCIHITNSCWNQSAFAVLRSLPFDEQGPYCMLKIAELFYLLCAHHALLDEMPDRLQSLGYSANSIHRVRDYMESHLDEKLTTLSLSRQFHLSSTALKSGFRAIYGQPIHTWLQNRRIQHAAELLQFSNMTVLQVAQSVGYDGVSQFNVIFKRIYGAPPSQYRKMSETRKI